MKLPAFYVLDAISKNVYEPYGRTFTSFIISLFLDTYAQVDQSTRSKMEEMLLTWRTGAPNGKELFGIGPQTAIERGIWGGGILGQVRVLGYLGRIRHHSCPTKQSSTSYGDSRQPHISQAQVISELEFTIGQKQRALQINPYDSISQGHLHVLEQVKSYE
jgi:pre-mRNA cleavage complex 2 protein Pcf11